MQPWQGYMGALSPATALPINKLVTHEVNYRFHLHPWSSTHHVSVTSRAPAFDNWNALEMPFICMSVVHRLPLGPV